MITDQVLDMSDNWVEEVEKVLSAAKCIPQRPPMTLDNLAYVVYSSGTTGKPKGQQPHNMSTSYMTILELSSFLFFNTSNNVKEDNSDTCEPWYCRTAFDSDGLMATKIATKN